MFEAIQQLDDSILFYILEHFHTPVLDRFMIFVTSLGNSGIIWIAITFLMLLNRKTRLCGILLTCSLLLELLLCDGIIKPFIGRERPFTRFPDVELLIKKPGSYSFPSGHTMSSFAAASVIVYSFKHAGIPALILACLIGFSRIYLFCHYPSDVLCGAVFGTALAIMVILIARYIQAKAKYGTAG